MTEKINRQIDEAKNQVEQEYNSLEKTNHERSQIQKRLDKIQSLQEKIMSSDLSVDHKEALLQKTLNIIKDVIHQDLKKHPQVQPSQPYSHPIQLSPYRETIKVNADEEKSAQQKLRQEVYEYKDEQGVAASGYQPIKFGINGATYGNDEMTYPEGTTEEQKKGIYKIPVIEEKYKEDLVGPEREWVLKKNTFQKEIDKIIEQVDLPLDTIIENLEQALDPENETNAIKEYTVAKGDSLSKIAHQCIDKETGKTLSWRDLQEYNNIDNASLIRVGQKIKIPEGYNIEGSQSVLNDHSPSVQKALQIIGNRENFTLDPMENFNTFASKNKPVQIKTEDEIMVDEMVDENLRDDVLSEYRRYEKYMDPDGDKETEDAYEDIINEIDGLMENESRAAVMAFQLNYNEELMERAYNGEDVSYEDFLPVDGKVTPQTLQKIVNTLKEYVGIDPVEEAEPIPSGRITCRNGTCFRQVVSPSGGVYPGPDPEPIIEEVPLTPEEVIEYKAMKVVNKIETRIQFADFSAFDGLVQNGKFISYNANPKGWNRAFEKALRKRISGNEADIVQQLIGTPGDWKPGPHTLYKLMQAQGLDPSTDARFNHNYIAQWEKKTNADIKKGNPLLQAERDGTTEIDEFSGEEGAGKKAIQKVIDEYKSNRTKITQE